MSSGARQSVCSSVNTATSAGDVVLEALGSEPPSAGLASESEPLGVRLASGCVWIGPSRMRVDGSWRSLMKIPLGDGKMKILVVDVWGPNYSANRKKAALF